MTKNISIHVILVVTIFEIILNSCKKDLPAFSIVSVYAGTINLTGSSPVAVVPVNAVIVANFSADIDPASIDAANISLVQDYNQATLQVNLSSNGKTISITPIADLGSGTFYKLTLKAGLKSKSGLAFAEVSFAFTTVGTFVPAGAVAYWNFENSANDQIGTFNASLKGIVDITYTASRNATAGTAATFNGTTSIIEIPKGDSLMNTPDFALSFWFKTNSTGHFDSDQNPAGYFVLGLSAFFGFDFEISADFGWCNFAASYDIGGGNTIPDDLTFIGDGKDKDHGAWQGWEFCRDLTGSGGVAGLIKDKWTHVVCMYEGSTKRGTMYINGEKMKVINFNLWPEDNERHHVIGLKYSGNSPLTVNEMAFGFIQSRAGIFYDSDPKYGYDFPTSNHFKGQLDDVRIFHKALTETEIQLMYNSEK